MPIRKRLMTAFCTILFGLSALALSAGADTDQTPPPGGPCAADVQKFCSDVQPGQGRLIACLKQHEADLSPECKEKGAELKEEVNTRIQNFERACGDDLQKFCSDIPAGHGRKLVCLKEHQSDLAPECQDILAHRNHKEEKSDDSSH